MRPSLVTCLLFAALAAETVLDASVARATPPSTCPGTPEPGIVSVLPADGAAGVTLDAWIRVRYTENYFTAGDPMMESITLTSRDGTPVLGRLEVVGDRDLFFRPSVPLAPNTIYDGVATSSVGFEFSFNTGTVEDSRPPTLLDPDVDPQYAISSAVISDSCEGASGSRRIGLTFTSATDDGPAASIDYYLYLTRGPGVTSPELVANPRNYGATTTIAFVLPPQKLQSVICVSLVAVDGVGKSTTWTNPSCFDPVTGTAFYGLCSASPLPASPAPTLPLAFAGLALVARRLVRSRRRD